jgi:hypothetical protein
MLVSLKENRQLDLITKRNNAFLFFYFIENCDIVKFELKNLPFHITT